MATIEVRQVQGQELLDTADPLTHYAFRPSPPHLDRAEREKNLPYRQDEVTLVLFEDGQPRSTITTLPMTQNVRGALVPMGAVASVATHPLGRRGGHARRVLTEAFARMRADGQVVSCLFPFRASFYGRLGYAGFPAERRVSFSPADLGPLLRQSLPGEVTAEPIADGHATYRRFLETIQPRLHGMALRSAQSGLRQRDRNALWLVVARVDGEPVGVMTYRIKGDPTEMETDAFFHANATGKYLLLQWLARHVDQIRLVRLTLPPSAYPETWLYDIGLTLKTITELYNIYDQMGRVVDVARLGGVGAGSGRFSAHLRDGQCPWNEGTFAFSAEDGRLVVAPTTAADCDLSIQGLAALLYGGYDPADFPFRGWGDPSPDTQAAMRSVFPPALPFLFENF
jgi:predicted acetyltransferase